jgi:tetratricopeptide (TPR) repeat protein
MRMRAHVLVAIGAAGLMILIEGALTAQSDPDARPATFKQAQHLFYNGRYQAAAALALELRDPAGQDLATYELRTSALLFQLKRLLENQPDKDAAFKACESCPALLADFLRDTASGQSLARAKLKIAPDDETLFFLGKLDLNYVWLHLDPLGKRTGWDEYWEARRSLDTVLEHNPRHVRAQVARAWIDYIVDTKMPRGTRWIMGGGSKDRALVAVRQAATTDTDLFGHAEAMFALWEMEVREKRIGEAVEAARSLAHDFPENHQIDRFLQKHDSTR